MSESIKDELVAGMCERLSRDESQLKDAFDSSAKQVGVRYVAIDDLLPEVVAGRLHEAFPTSAQMRLMKSFRECNYTMKNFEKFAPLLRRTSLLQSTIRASWLSSSASPLSLRRCRIGICTQRVLVVVPQWLGCKHVNERLPR